MAGKPKRPVGSNGKQLGGVTGKGFMPGRSGNPAGRSKSMAAFAEEFRACAKPGDAGELYRILFEHAKSEDPRAAVPAVKELLDRLGGKAFQEFGLSDMTTLTQEERATRVAEFLVRALERKEGK